MSFVARVERIKSVSEAPKRKSGVRILKDVNYEQLASECRICQRLKLNKGPCGGRTGQNICLAFKESPAAKLREQTLEMWAGGSSV